MLLQPPGDPFLPLAVGPCIFGPVFVGQLLIDIVKSLQLLVILILHDGEKIADILNGEHLLEQEDIDKRDQVAAGVALFIGAGQDARLGVVINHGIGEYLVLRVPCEGAHLLVEERDDLLHVQIHLGDVAGLDQGRLSDLLDQPADLLTGVLVTSITIFLHPAPLSFLMPGETSPFILSHFIIADGPPQRDDFDLSAARMHAGILSLR